MQAPARQEFGQLHLEAVDKIGFDVDLQTWDVVESLSGGFHLELFFDSSMYDVPFDKIVGYGAALSMTTKRLGTRVWAGVATEFELINAQVEQSREGPTLPEPLAKALASVSGGPQTRGISRYRLLIRDVLWRLRYRTNCRIFQQKNAIEIIEDLLKEWDIELDKSLIKDTEKHAKYEYRVQYNETDYDFFCRILEEDGITWFTKAADSLPKEEKKKGRELTKIHIANKPHEEKPVYGKREDEEKYRTIRFAGANPRGNHEFDPHLWYVSARQETRPGSYTVRDANFRTPMDRPTIAEAPFPRTGAPVGTEQRQEIYAYKPNSTWMSDGQPGKLSDDRGKARSDEAQAKLHVERGLGAIISGRIVVKFETNVLDLPPGANFAIATDDETHPAYKDRHPNAMFGPGVRMLVVRRHIHGEQHGDAYTVHAEAVFSRDPYRPAPITPKPRIPGLQSAVVVGPANQEIHTDEFGRIRVQFPWDREGKFDEKSSCWMRVNQSWSGGGFGMQILPRVGHEVLVGFYEGDPDQPVVVGSVYNGTTKQPWDLGSQDNWTKSGIKTDTSPHGKGQAGFNELMFQDKKGHELVHLQAENAFAVVAKNTESHAAGSSFSVTVGRDKGGGNSTFVMSPNKIELRTKGASIILADGTITIESHTNLCMHTGSGPMHITGAGDIQFLAGAGITMSSVANTTIDTGGQLLLNCASPAPKPKEPSEPKPGPAAGTATKGPHPVPHPVLPPPEAPGGFREIEIGKDPNAAAAAAPKAPAAAGAADDAAEDASEMKRIANRAATAKDALTEAARTDSPSMLGKVLEKFDIKNTDNVLGAVVEKATGKVMSTVGGKLEEAATGMLTKAIQQGSFKGVFDRKALMNDLRTAVAGDAAGALFTAAKAIPGVDALAAADFGKIGNAVKGAVADGAQAYAAQKIAGFSGKAASAAALEKAKEGAGAVSKEVVAGVKGAFAGAKPAEAAATPELATPPFVSPAVPKVAATTPAAAPATASPAATPAATPAEPASGDGEA